MLDIILSLCSLGYFVTTTIKYDGCYYSALIMNVLHIVTQIFLLLPILYKIGRRFTFDGFNREIVKISIKSKFAVPVFIVCSIVINLICLYSIIIHIFNWQNYTYLFTVFCLTSSSLSTASKLVKPKFDCSFVFSLEVYKFFTLAVASILFGISAYQIKLAVQILGMGWAYFVYRSKQSLPKQQAFYFLMLFLDVVILLTAIMVIGASQSLKDQPFSDSQLKFKIRIIFSVTFFGLLFCLQVFEFIKMYKKFGRRSSANELTYQQNLIKFYLYIQKLKQKVQHDRRTPQQQCCQSSLASLDNLQQKDCSICLQVIKQKKLSKGEPILLQCSHIFHQQCLEQWAYIKPTCPMCRKSLLQDQSSYKINL